MKKYNIRYTETYQRWYEIEANSQEEAEEKLLDVIMNGKEKGPDECCDSKCEVIEITLEEYLQEEGIDRIEDDEEFCRAEFEAIRDYFLNYNVTEEDIAEVRARGYDEEQFRK